MLKQAGKKTAAGRTGQEQPVMLHSTEGLVIRSVRYGESSVITTIFTELFGIQSYIVNGVRGASAKRARGNLLQPGNLLELVAYHRDQQHLQRISEFRLAHIYRSIQLDVVKNTVALYLIELLQQALRQPEAQPELFAFVKDSFLLLDENDRIGANLPLFFTLRLGRLLGFGLDGRYSAATPYLDLQEGHFVAGPPLHAYFLEPENSRLTDRLLQTRETADIAALELNKELRRQLLHAYLDYFRLHLPDFRELRSPPILHEILDA